LQHHCDNTAQRPARNDDDGRSNNVIGLSQVRDDSEPGRHQSCPRVRVVTEEWLDELLGEEQQSSRRPAVLLDWDWPVAAGTALSAYLSLHKPIGHPLRQPDFGAGKAGFT
jgi:hypothetical protein